MKKLITIILILALILPAAALSDIPDVSGKTDQELKDLISACSIELRERASTPDGWVLLFEYDGIQLYQIDEAEIFLGSLRVPVALCNNTDRDTLLCVKDCLCNGWDITGGSCSAKHNSKKKDSLYFHTENSDVKSIDEITSLQFRWDLIDTTEKAVSVYEQTEPEEHRFW